MVLNTTTSFSSVHEVCSTFPVTATLDARGHLAWTSLGIILFFFDHYIISGEVIGFRLFRATGLAFAIRPKDGVARRRASGRLSLLLLQRTLEQR